MTTVRLSPPSSTERFPKETEGLKAAALKVTLSHPAPLPMTIDWTAYDASAPQTTQDSGQVSFAVGEREKSILVRYMADDAWALGRTIEILMTKATNATPQGRGRLFISEDDVHPAVTIHPLTVRESDGTATVRITLSAPWATGAGYSYDTVKGTATAPGDFTAVTRRSLNFAGYQMEATIIVPLVNDAIIEETESFTIVIGDVSGTVTILDDDAKVRRRATRH